MIKVGLIGMGYWGPNLARVLNQTATCDFYACCDLDKQKVEKTVRHFPNVLPMTSVDDLLDSEVDAVVIATPIASHYELARKALQAGKHVMVEKPLAHNSRCAHELVKLAADKGLTLFTGHTFIYSPPVQAIKRLIDSGELGELHYISLSRMNLGLYQKDVDVVWDLAVHDISILLYWLGESPVRGISYGRACVQSQKRDVAFMWMEFASGLIASTEVSWLSPQKMRRTCIVGSKRMVVYDDTEPNEKVKIYNKGVDWRQPESFGEFQLSYRMGEMVAPFIGNAEPLLQEIEHYVHCVEGGEQTLTANDFGARVVDVLELLQSTSFCEGNVTKVAPAES